MTFGFQNLIVLFALAAVAIPVLIHLLNRRRYDVVDWGAMQFLQLSRTTRRRLRLEELLLLLLRMGLIAVLVLALAGPFGGGGIFDSFGDRPPRDLVVVLDGSASMAREDDKGPTPFEAAKAWARRLLDELGSEDRVALVLARERPISLVGVLTADHAEVRGKLQQIGPPGGSADLPRALEEAQRILAGAGRAAHRQIVVLRDDQRWGWADSETILRWEKLAPRFDGASQRVSILATGLQSFESISRRNFSLAPITTTQAMAWSGQQVKFHAALRLEGFSAYEAPWRLRTEIDTRAVEDLPLPRQSDLAKGQIGLRFAHRFATAGSHVVSVIVEPDLPPEARPRDYRLTDCLPGDNRQNFALTVHETLPVLLVDGERELRPDGSTFFVNQALAQSPDPKRPAVMRTRVVSHVDFRPEMLRESPEHPEPRVLVLADVPRLTAQQQAAIAQFLGNGGGLLVVLGGRVDRDEYNRDLFAEGAGFLPARLESIGLKKRGAAALDVRGMPHPALRLFAAEPSTTLAQARLPRWHKVVPAKNAVVGAVLDSDDPLLVERPFGEGRVLLWAAPLDRSWGGNLPGILEYPVLIHELVGYLADGGGIEQNVASGQALRYRPRWHEPVALPARLVLQPPYGDAESFRVQRWPWIYEKAREPGVYRLTIDDGRTIHYVVQADPREFDLTPCTQEDRRRVAQIIPVEYGEALPEVAGEATPQDLWWIFLLAVIGLLCVEVWMTRRMVRAQEGAA